MTKGAIALKQAEDFLCCHAMIQVFDHWLKQSKAGGLNTGCGLQKMISLLPFLSKQPFESLSTHVGNNQAMHLFQVIFGCIQSSANHRTTDMEKIQKFSDYIIFRLNF